MQNTKIEVPAYFVVELWKQEKFKDYIYNLSSTDRWKLPVEFISELNKYGEQKYIKERKFRQYLHGPTSQPPWYDTKPHYLTPK